ncbi:MAG: GNAT family N-acetyltransferase [Roseicyclus sp.]|uniref:GNAT family N-acetyltransferase n=1 Tax=Roseicyclus sp. TaxID=1914329 RepID=UPI003A83CF39
MKMTSDPTEDAADIVALFQMTFTRSEGAEVGASIAGLVSDMLAQVAASDILVLSAHEGDRLIGAVIFTRMDYPQDPRQVFILSPMAVAPDRQGQGVGLALLQEGLARLRARGVDVVLTYGDIGFYGRGGFAPVPQECAAAPLPLTYLEGWLGQDLTGSGPVTLTGPSRCVAPLEKPEFW